MSKHLLISWLQSPSAVILEPQKIKSLTVPISIFQSVSSKSTLFVAQFREPSTRCCLSHWVLENNHKNEKDLGPNSIYYSGSTVPPTQAEGLLASLPIQTLYLMAFKKPELSSFLAAKCLQVIPGRIKGVFTTYFDLHQRDLQFPSVSWFLGL